MTKRNCDKYGLETILYYKIVFSLKNIGYKATYKLADYIIGVSKTCLSTNKGILHLLELIIK